MSTEADISPALKSSQNYLRSENAKMERANEQKMPTETDSSSGLIFDDCMKDLFMNGRHIHLPVVMTTQRYKMYPISPTLPKGLQNYLRSENAKMERANEQNKTNWINI